MEKRYAKIISTGRYLPERVMTNAEFEPLVGDVDAWLKENVGIAERRVVDNETTSDMCTAAARQALERADLDPADIDLIILGTDTPDYISPATAPILQHKLGALNSGTFDINSACASWVAGLDVAAKQITVDIDINNVLVVGGYAMTRFLDYHDKRTCTLFGDGAGAVVMSVSDEPGYLASKLISKGQYYKSWGIYTGGAASPVNDNDLNRPVMQFLEKFPTTFNNDNWPPLIRQTVAKAGLAAVDEVDFFLFTQLNVNTIKDVMQQLNQPLEKTHWIMDKWGYTGASCIPMALDDALVEGKGPRPGDVVLFCATGGGFSIACAIFKW
ncbi:MAG: ketoacyl-ACP synthase III [Desulfobacterales bacterium]|jgi:3-oxoacyl-[acyl-carrier-protein] synthase-3|nr:ketoacyl-ACP synthase III [Desulfobacterales bacterium]